MDLIAQIDARIRLREAQERESISRLDAWMDTLLVNADRNLEVWLRNANLRLANHGCMPAPQRNWFTPQSEDVIISFRKDPEPVSIHKMPSEPDPGLNFIDDVMSRFRAYDFTAVDEETLDSVHIRVAKESNAAIEPDELEELLSGSEPVHEWEVTEWDGASSRPSGNSALRSIRDPLRFR